MVDIESEKTKNSSGNNNSLTVKSKIKSYLIEAAQTTTTHGIDKIVLAKRNFLKLFWLLLFVASIAVCCYFMANTVIEYLQYEVVTKVQVIYEVPQLFPTISICNLNIFNNNQSIEFAKKILAENSITDPFSNTFIGFDMTPPLVSILVKYLVAANFRNPNLTDDATIRRLGIKYDEFFISCTFNIEPCNSSLFEWYFDITYGSCFKFNSNKQTGGPLYSYRAGSLNGFRVELFIADITDPYSFSADSGAYVIVQNATDTSPNHVGVKAQIGTETDIQLERHFIRKLEKPYSECIKDISSSQSDLYRIFVDLGKEYRQSDCFDLCYQTYVAKECGCIDATFYPLPSQPYCMNTTQLVCNLKSFLRFFDGNNLKSKCSSQCPLECDSETFRLTISSSSYPTRAYADQLANYSGDILASFYPNRSHVTSYEQLRENILAINLYFGDMKYTSIEELEKMSFFDLVSAVGGTLGLFIGMSFLSFFELLDVLIEILFIIIIDSRQKRTNKVQFLKKNTTINSLTSSSIRV